MTGAETRTMVAWHGHFRMRLCHSCWWASVHICNVGHSLLRPALRQLLMGLMHTHCDMHIYPACCPCAPITSSLIGFCSCCRRAAHDVEGPGICLAAEYHTMSRDLRARLIRTCPCPKLNSLVAARVQLTCCKAGRCTLGGRFAQVAARRTTSMQFTADR